MSSRRSDRSPAARRIKRLPRITKARNSRSRTYTAGSTRMSPRDANEVGGYGFGDCVATGGPSDQQIGFIRHAEDRSFGRSVDVIERRLTRDNLWRNADSNAALPDSRPADETNLPVFAARRLDQALGRRANSDSAYLIEPGRSVHQALRENQDLECRIPSIYIE